MKGQKKQTKKAVEPRIIISMTTMPWRCQNIKATVDSVFNGNKKPDKFVLYITHDDFKEIPEHLVKLSKENDKFEVHWSDKNYKVATKLLPALKEYPDDIIINLDDDYTYAPDLIESLYNCYLLDKDAVVTVAGHRIAMSTDGFLFNAGCYTYNKYDTLVKYKTKSFDIMHLSGHGTLYPPHIFDGTDVFNDKERMKFWDTQDEMWCWMNLICANKQIAVCGDYCNRWGHPWTMKNFYPQHPLWQVNNGKEKGQLRAATEYIRRHNPSVLKYFVCRDLKVVHPTMPGVPVKTSSISNPNRHKKLSEMMFSDIFKPDGFILEPTLQPAPKYQ